MSTDIDMNQLAFSKRAHMIAREKIYPLFFNIQENETLEFFNCDFTMKDIPQFQFQRLLDVKLGIDRIIKVKKKLEAWSSFNSKNVPLHHDKFLFTFQERFRKIEQYGREDITITESNGLTGVPSELYKLGTQFFVYGFLNKSEEDFKDLFIINIPLLMLKILNKEIKMEYGPCCNNRGQYFVTIKVNELLKFDNIISFRYKK